MTSTDITAALSCRCDKQGTGGLIAVGDGTHRPATIVPCLYPATREDGLCDHCRRGCGLMCYPPVHVDQTGLLDCAPRINDAMTPA